MPVLVSVWRLWVRAHWDALAPLWLQAGQWVRVVGGCSPKPGSSAWGWAGGEIRHRGAAIFLKKKKKKLNQKGRDVSGSKQREAWPVGMGEAVPCGGAFIGAVPGAGRAGSPPSPAAFGCVAQVTATPCAASSGPAGPRRGEEDVGRVGLRPPGRRRLGCLPAMPVPVPEAC